MDKKILKFDQFEKVYEARLAISDPVGVAVLGTPAGGKSFVSKKLDSVIDDARISRAMKSGEVLTVDILRSQFMSKDPKKQLKGFIEAFYVMKQKSKNDPKEYGKWFEDISNLWLGKFKNAMPSLDINIENGELYFGEKLAISRSGMKLLDSIDTPKVIDQLDKYHDYKRVVRYFQTIKQEKAIVKKKDVTYDEAGDEPEKIISNMKDLHKKGYVTDVILIHPENVATNLIQNYFRVLSGNDGGRDSSDAIMQAFREIEANKDVYTKNAEVVVKTTSKELDKAAEEIKKANVEDDKSRGDKPIDILAEIQPMSPDESYSTFVKKLESEFDTPENLFKAVLKVAALTVKNIDANAKGTLLRLSQPLSKRESLKYIKQAYDSKKYIHKFGGINDEFIAKSESVLK
jgi:hypothetical protein